MIWARTLELLDGHLDIDTILDAGIAGCRMQIFAKGSKVGEIGLSETDSRFVGALFMPQYDIERLLSDRLAELGVVVSLAFPRAPLSSAQRRCLGADC